MGNTCCAGTKELPQVNSVKSQLSASELKSQFHYEVENYESSEDEEVSPIQKMQSLSFTSKVELDFTLSSLNSRKRQTKLQQSLQLDSLHKERQSIRISSDSFVTLKQRNVDDYYDLVKKLGSGSYGHVWKVKHKQTGLMRAMKQLKKSCLLLEDQQRMLSEMNVLKNLDHPNIVKVYECYQNDMSYYIITEYLSGGELFNQIKIKNIFTEEMAAEYLRQIMRAVAYCHDKNIVHRDIKPENILLQNNQRDAQLKIIDFGTSRYFKSDSIMKKKLGTPYYIAPEVLSEKYNEKVDIWSCGVILYIFLCGYPPFNGRTDQDTLSKVKSAKLELDPRDWANVSLEAKNLVKGMLDPNPQRRLSAKQVLDHPWIQMNTYQNMVTSIALQNLQKFQAQSYFKKTMLSFMVNQTLPAEDVRELQNCFAGLDQDQDGLLSKEELILGYKNIIPNYDLAELKVNQILEYVDINFSGKVDYSEFVMAAINVEKLVSVHRVKEAFMMLDLNGDGYLSKEELEEAMGTLGEDVWEQYLFDCDYNKDGKISESEFLHVLLSKI